MIRNIIYYVSKSMPSLSHSISCYLKLYYISSCNNRTTLNGVRSEWAYSWVLVWEQIVQMKSQGLAATI